MSFTPGRTYRLDVTAGGASASVQVDANAPLVRLLNTGPATVYIRMGTGAQTATLADFPLGTYVPEQLGKGVGADTVAAIAGPDPPPPDPDNPPAATVSVLYVTTGHG